MKSREAAIDEIGEEFQQNGSQLLRKLESRHEKDFTLAMAELEQRRKYFISTCHVARRDVGKLSGDLSAISLKAVMDGLLDKGAVGKLQGIKKGLEAA